MENELKNIVEKVKMLYQKYGIKSISMDDVARELGISKKTLYQYVADKEDLVRRVYFYEMDGIYQKINQIAKVELNAIEQALEVNKIINQALKLYKPSIEYDLKKYYPQLHEEILRVKRENMFNSHLENMRKGQNEGLFRKDFNPEIIAKLMVSRIEYILSENFFPVNEFTSEEVFKEVFIYHLRGICSEIGIKFYEEKMNETKINNE